MAEAKPFEVHRHDVFHDWIISLRDAKARARIGLRLRRLELGNPGEVEAVGDGISEMKIDYGPGYRVYYVATDTQVVLLSCGGDKSSQSRDIKRAKELANEVRSEKF
jgi:putative addiction module killer protein